MRRRENSWAGCDLRVIALDVACWAMDDHHVLLLKVVVTH